MTASDSSTSSKDELDNSLVKANKIPTLTRVHNTTAAATKLNLPTRFDDLGVEPWLVKSLSAMAITRPTPIQASCIPEILEGL